MSQAEAAVAEPQAEESSTESKYRLNLGVNIENVGPCRKHVRVKVPRADIQHFDDEAVKEVVETAMVPGFRKGRVPANLARRRFKDEISDTVRQRVLMLSLEQLAEDSELDPINEPDFDVESLKIPEEGDFEYEFDIEVRPTFDIPKYDGLTITRPVREVTDEDVAAYKHRFLAQYNKLEDRNGPAESNDFINASIDITRDGKAFRRITSVSLQLVPVIRFRDSEITGFDQLMAGCTTGDVKSLKITISKEAETVELRGESLDANVTVTGVKRSVSPEFNKAFFEGIGYEDEQQFEDEIRGMLNRQVTYDQRQACRKQVLDKITESATWELPESLVAKQTENALRREMLEMQQAGFTTQQILARENELRQASVSSTRQALKEHFVLDRIATEEKIEATPIDIESEINMMAVQRGESPRRVRARLQKSGVIENLEAQIRERKAVDFILKTAKFEDVPAPKRESTENIQAVQISICGISSVVVEPEVDDKAAD